MLNDAQITSILVSQQQQRLIEETAAAFADAKIRFIPLKGIVTRRLYPESFQRRSADVDILVEEKNLNAAAAVLTDKLSYTRLSRSENHDIFKSPYDIKLELHHSLMDARSVQCAVDVLAKVWQHSTPASENNSCCSFCGKEYEYVLDDAMFYTYHIAHMAKHFMMGNLPKKYVEDLKYIKRDDTLLKEAGLSKFEYAVTHMDEFPKLKSFYESDKNRNKQMKVAAGTAAKANTAGSNTQSGSSAASYLLSRLFPPLKLMSKMYPYLQSAPVLLPFAWMQRAVMLIKKGRAFRLKDELFKAASLDPNDVNLMKELFEELF